MAFAFNPETRQITLPLGDTADLYVNVNWDGLSEGDAILFAIFDPDGDGDLLCKAADLEDGRAHIRLCNHDTRPATRNISLAAAHRYGPRPG